MPISGKGMLITAMNVEPTHDADFNLWYDREHIAERVAIDGFVEARRYRAVDAEHQYFSTYTTAAFEDLSGPAYRTALANQTDWSKTNLSRAQNMLRVVGRIAISKGLGRGVAMAVVRLRPDDKADQNWLPCLAKLLDPGMLPEIISMHLIQSDPDLSTSLTEPTKPNPGANDWFVLIEGTTSAAVERFARSHVVDLGMEVISVGSYQLLWDLHHSEI